jgi:hypothetical protein
VLADRPGSKFGNVYPLGSARHARHRITRHADGCAHCLAHTCAIEEADPPACTGAGAFRARRLGHADAHHQGATRGPVRRQSGDESDCWARDWGRPREPPTLSRGDPANAPHRLALALALGDTHAVHNLAGGHSLLLRCPLVVHAPRMRSTLSGLGGGILGGGSPPYLRARPRRASACPTRTGGGTATHPRRAADACSTRLQLSTACARNARWSTRRACRVRRGPRPARVAHPPARRRRGRAEREARGVRISELRRAVCACVR